jgi:hypothetical protein
MSDHASALASAEAQVDAVRDDPAARLALMADLRLALRAAARLAHAEHAVRRPGARTGSKGSLKQVEQTLSG